MADEPNKPKAPAPDAEGAGTKLHKPTKAELAKLPGGEDFDADGASSEDFDRHYEILARRAKLAGLQTAPATPLVAVAAETAPAVASAPQPLDPIEAVHNVTGERRRFSETTWGLLGDDRQGWELAVSKPADLN